MNPVPGHRLAVLLAVVLGAGLGRVAGADTNAPTPPPLPSLRSPVQVFRELLVMSPAELDANLTLRPPGMREQVEAKVQEYLALPPEERELRLQATELRFYLLQLMPLPATNRTILLQQIPEPMRTAVAGRIELWNILPPAMQEEVLESEQTVRYFTQLGVATPAQRQAMLDAMPAAQQEKLHSWQRLPEATRTRLMAQFNQFFTLTPAERDKTLGSLSEAERAAMEQTLDSFAELTPEQRRICIASFEKFASMGPAERQEFLKKAEAWQRMTPTEREQWRELVTRVPQLPPLPPGMVPVLGATPRPPRPPLTRPEVSTPTTNGG